MLSVPSVFTVFAFLRALRVSAVNPRLPASPKRPQARRSPFRPVFTRAACKPSSVPCAVSFATAIDGGSSQKTFTPAATISLGLQLPTTSSSLPACIVRTRLKRTLFGLARGGVCHAAPVTSGAVGSYPTFSPLPAPCKHDAGGIFSVALSRVRSAADLRQRCANGWALPTTVSCRARTFLSSSPCSKPPRLPRRTAKV